MTIPNTVLRYHKAIFVISISAFNFQIMTAFVMAAFNFQMSVERTMNKLATPIPKMIHSGSGLEFHKVVAETRGQVKVLLRHRGTGAS